MRYRLFSSAALYIDAAGMTWQKHFLRVWNLKTTTCVLDIVEQYALQTVFWACRSLARHQALFNYQVCCWCGRTYCCFMSTDVVDILSTDTVDTKNWLIYWERCPRQTALLHMISFKTDLPREFCSVLRVICTHGWERCKCRRFPYRICWSRSVIQCHVGQTSKDDSATLTWCIFPIVFDTDLGLPLDACALWQWAGGGYIKPNPHSVCWSSACQFGLDCLVCKLRCVIWDCRLWTEVRCAGSPLKQTLGT